MRLIDLTLPIVSGMEVYPGDPPVDIRVVHTHEQHGWELRKLTMGTHTGTHVDAFSHMHKGAGTLDEIPLDRFCGMACVADAKRPFPRGAGLIFREAAGLELLEKIREVRPPFVAGEISEELERALLKEEMVTYTQLTRLEQLPANDPFWFIGFPLKLAGADGSPVRAVAVLFEPGDTLAGLPGFPESRR